MFFWLFLLLFLCVYDYVCVHRAYMYFLAFRPVVYIAVMNGVMLFIQNMISFFLLLFQSVLLEVNLIPVHQRASPLAGIPHPFALCSVFPGVTAHLAMWSVK